MKVLDVFKYIYIGYFTDKVCYQPYGCFDKSPPFNSLYLPLPENPATLDTTFYLYDRSNPNGKSFNHSNSFNGSKKLVVIAHGFLESSEIWWMRDIARQILNTEDCNVILINWKKAAKVPYNQAVSNIRITSSQTSYLLEKLFSETSLKPWNVHLVGFSLGAHLMGYIGKELSGKGLMIHRITGLDPAGPLFAGSHIDFRLDHSDAMFVDVIHTDSKSPLHVVATGTLDRLGHSDFYPNGGYSQPGCNSEVTFNSFVSKKEIYDRVTCHHYRAVLYFIGSIGDANAFSSYKCQSYYKFKTGQCSEIASPSNTNKMGYHANESRTGQYYLLTGSTAPYSGKNYIVDIYTGDELLADTYGSIVLQLNGMGGESVVKKENGKFINRNSVMRHVLYARNQVGDLISLNIEHSPFPFNDYWLIQKVVVKSLDQPNEVYFGCINNRWINDIGITVKLSKEVCR